MRKGSLRDLTILRVSSYTICFIKAMGDKGDHAPHFLQLRHEEKKDVFDSDAFDAVHFINKIYPDGECIPSIVDEMIC